MEAGLLLVNCGLECVFGGFAGLFWIISTGRTSIHFCEINGAVFLVLLFYI